MLEFIVIGFVYMYVYHHGCVEISGNGIINSILKYPISAISNSNSSK